MERIIKMRQLKTGGVGIVLCLCMAVPCFIFGRVYPVIGGAVPAIILGMVMALIIKNKEPYREGVRFVSKKILQYAVILLGFGMNLKVIVQTGKESLPIIVCTISVSLIISYVLCKVMKMDRSVATLVGVGSSICGGSAIAATAPVIEANDEEVAQSISVIFLFNIIAAIVFPILGTMLGFSQADGNAFGVFAGTAVNDTSSVTAAAATWDSMFNLGTETLDRAVTVKLTRTLAIIPITLVLAFMRTHSHRAAVRSGEHAHSHVSLKKIFPFFILYFVAASIITTILLDMGVPSHCFHPMKELSKFLIVMAMSAIGFGTDVVKLVKTGGKPLLMGFCCWCGITLTSLGLQHVLHIW